MDKKKDNKTNKKTSNKNKNFKSGILKGIVILVVVLAVISVGSLLGFYTASLKSIPNLKDEIQPDVSSQIFDINGKIIANVHAGENRVPVSINKIPENLQNAFIATEDVRFYQHSGIDPRGILRAVWANVTGGQISEGASTITQQLARNAMLSQEQTLTRKLNEAILALQIERQYSKTEILEMYMNQIYFGQGAYGVQSAANLYFGKNVEDLTLAECAIIAGIPKSPNYYSPLNNLDASKERGEVVLAQMEKYGFIDHATLEQAKNQEIKIISRSNDIPGAYFIDYVVQILIDKYGANAVYKEGLKIYTTLDLDMQNSAEAAMKQLPVYRNKDELREPQGALVAIDPKTGHIKAMVGGRGDDQFNRAVLAERQPGSAFKPFVYLAAIEKGYSPATMIMDSPITVGSWSPRNYDGTFKNEPVSMRHALERSLNSVAVRVGQEVTPEKFLYCAKQLGISSLVMSGAHSDVNLSAALGGLTRGVTPLEMASAYGVIANLGVRVEPMAIVKVVARDGSVLEENHSTGKSVVKASSAYVLVDMMKGVLTRGTGGGANIGRPMAAKTGTTSDYKDAWFVGFTPDLSVAVWIGDDENYSLRGMTGGMLPATIFRTFMTGKGVIDKYPASDFPKPSGVTTARVSSKDGLLVDDEKNKDSYMEIFVSGTEPKKISSVELKKDDKKDDKKNNDGKEKDNKKPSSINTKDNDKKDTKEKDNKNTKTNTSTRPSSLPPPPDR